MTGYSDRINHALAFAAKHHDQQVRRGTRLPYFTQPANVAVILTRYGCREEVVTAGILLKVVEDYVREGVDAERLQQRIGDKFGTESLRLALDASERRVDDDGTEMDADERRQDFLERQATAPADAHWVVVADAVHAAGSLLADLRRTVDPSSVWGRQSGGPERSVRALRRLHDRLEDLGFQAPILRELGDTVASLEHHAGLTFR